MTKPIGLRNVIALALVSFFTDFSTEMILGILPLFIVNNLGASRSTLGAIEGSAELISYAFRMVSGSLSDKVGKRKIFVLAGYSLSTLARPFFAFSTGWLDAFLVRAGDRIGKGLRTAPRDALIADSVYESSSGKAFGLHRTIDQTGAILGPIAAFGLLQIMDVRGIFLVSIIPGAIAVIILIFLVKEIAVFRGRREQQDNIIKVRIFSNVTRVIKNNRPFAVLLVISAIFSLGAYNFSFVLLRASDFGVPKDFIPIVFAIINIAHTAVGIPSGLLADKIGKEHVLIIGYTVFIVSSLLMVTLNGNGGGGGSTSAGGNFVYAYIIAVIFGIYVGISETVQRAVVPKYITSELRGTAFGVYNVVLGTGFFISNIIFGFLWDNYTIKVAILYSIVFALASVIGMLMFTRKKYRISGGYSSTSKESSKTTPL